MFLGVKKKKKYRTEEMVMKKQAIRSAIASNFDSDIGFLILTSLLYFLLLVFLTFFNILPIINVLSKLT